MCDHSHSHSKASIISTFPLQFFPNSLLSDGLSDVRLYLVYRALVIARNMIELSYYHLWLFMDFYLFLKKASCHRKRLGALFMCITLLTQNLVNTTVATHITSKFSCNCAHKLVHICKDRLSERRYYDSLLFYETHRRLTRMVLQYLVVVVVFLFNIVAFLILPRD